MQIVRRIYNSRNLIQVLNNDNWQTEAANLQQQKFNIGIKPVIAVDDNKDLQQQKFNIGIKLQAVVKDKAISTIVEI